MEILYDFNIFHVLLLIAGIILTVITVRRMVIGAISIPRWTKILLTVGMILMNLLLFISLLPPIQVDVDNPFVNEDIHIVTPGDPSESAAAGK